jgi:Fur family ferric uptake transcriptional regulator
MARSYSVPAADAPDLESAIAAMRAHGLRASAPRRLVLEALYAADGPLTAEQIAGGDEDRPAAGDVTSVYRNLERLEEAGLVRHFHLGHGPALYARAGAAQREFLVCESCGRVTSVDPDDLAAVRREIRRRFGHEASFAHFPVGGLCSTCRDRSAAG